MSALTGNNIAANGNYEISVKDPGRFFLMLSGTFSSATVTVKHKDPSGNYLTYKEPDGTTDMALTAGGMREIAAVDDVQLAVAGGSTPDIDVQLIRLP